jgi:malonyl-CoA/methylmalonyl-CoA synthetase
MPAPPLFTVSRLSQRLGALAALDRAVLVDDSGPLGFPALLERAAELAGALRRSGLAGTRLALLAPQDRYWVEGFLAIILAGGTAVPISPLHPAPEQAAFVAQSRAAALLAPPRGVEVPANLALPSLRFADGRLLSTPAFTPADSPALDAGEAHTGLLLFTSGTTGKPKGVPLSHHNLFEGAEALRQAWQIGERDRLLHALPLHHLHGICVALLTALLAGASVQLLPRYDAGGVLEALAGATLLMGVPTQHRLLAEHVDRSSPAERARSSERLQALRLLTSGSAKLPEGLGRTLQALSGQYPLERYGMTEVGIVLSNPLVGERRPGSCGVPLPGCELRVVNETGELLPPGTPGELWIRGPSVFRGYDGDAQATASAFSAGFFKSGDTAVQSADGYVRLLGRTSVDIIKSGGYKLSALEIEEQLASHPEVQEAAVVGVADELWGERVVAAVVARGKPADAGAFAAELRAWLKRHIASYKVPKDVVLLAELPRNSMGKVQKPALLTHLARLAKSAERASE